MKITKTQLRKLIKEELEMADLKSDDTAELSDKIAHQEYADERAAKLKQAEEESEQTLDEALLFEAEKSKWVAKIVDYVQKLAGRYGPEFVGQVCGQLCDAAEGAVGALAGDSADIDDGSYGI